MTLTIPRMTDAELVEFCPHYPDYFVEVTAEGQVIIRPPNYSLTLARRIKIARALDGWAEADGRGIATESSGRFVLPNGARRSPDASSERLSTQTSSEIRRFWRLCLEFVIELRSTHDRRATLRTKTQEWIRNGAELAWTIDPEARTVEIYRPGAPVETLTDAKTIVAGPPINGFQLDWKRFGTL